eukprot:COSAG05_NODE_26042_length_191_cov_44.152174_1_plen_47_part_10
MTEIHVGSCGVLHFVRWITLGCGILGQLHHKRYPEAIRSGSLITFYF